METAMTPDTRDAYRAIIDEVYEPIVREAKWSAPESVRTPIYDSLVGVLSMDEMMLVRDAVCSQVYAEGVV